MRTKTLLLAVTLSVAAVASSFAQSTNVFSVNAVGYVNLTAPPGFSMISNPLNATNNTVSSLFSVPNGVSIYKYNQAQGFIANNFFFGWTDPNMTLVPGEGIFFQNPFGTNLNLLFVGEVMQGNLTNAVPAGYSIQSSQVPQAGRLDVDLGFPVVNGDSVYFFNNASGGYTAFNYFFGWNVQPTNSVGQSFFVNKAGTTNWVRNFSANN